MDIYRYVITCSKGQTFRTILLYTINSTPDEITFRMALFVAFAMSSTSCRAISRSRFRLLISSLEEVVSKVFSIFTDITTYLPVTKYQSYKLTISDERGSADFNAPTF